MPDESCRNCGNKLSDFLKCSECNVLYQEICLKCRVKSLPRYHNCEFFSKTSVTC